MAHHKKGRKKRHKALYLTSGILLFFVVAGVVVLSVLHAHSVSKAGAQLDQAEDEGPAVDTVKLNLTPGQQTLNLIGEARPIVESTVYAKLSGYLRAINVDKGDHVKAGQILGKIESPETDQAYFAARADEANKTRIARRMKILEKRKLISAQEAEQAFANADIARANLSTEQVLKGYEDLRAPFDGIVTARYADPGDLIQNGSNSQSSSMAIVTIAQTDILRIYVYVDQKDAPAVKVGQAVKIHVNERPDKIYLGTVRRLTDELDPRTRMLLTEIDYDNAKHDFVAGSFVSVELTLEKPRMLQVPVEALIYRNEKSFLGVVGQDQHVHLEPITVIDDDGIIASLVGPVRAGTSVALALGPNVQDGAKIKISKRGGDQNQQAKNGKDQGGQQNGGQQNEGQQTAQSQNGQNQNSSGSGSGPGSGVRDETIAGQSGPAQQGQQYQEAQMQQQNGQQAQTQPPQPQAQPQAQTERLRELQQRLGLGTQPSPAIPPTLTPTLPPDTSQYGANGRAYVTSDADPNKINSQQFFMARSRHKK